ncbi:MAG TPA: ARMT1-like domain-containing protein [Clostridia bacterium]|nr:ARMT1-like domain-containing protein [Clostridia bacterium]
MKLQPECVTCIIAQVKNVTNMFGLSERARKAAMDDTNAYLAKANYEGCTPESMGELWQILLGHVGGKDPYSAIKSLCNQEAMKMLPATREKIARAKDPFTVALKYAIAGNLIDYGLEHPVSLEQQNEQIDAIAATAFSIDDSDQLHSALTGAKTMLYLGDNAGEIVFDKLLIEQIKSLYPAVAISFVVKGSPVLNDVTLAEANEVGMQEVARVIDNGDASPGTVLPRTSESFREEFAKADVILSKGQGNFESLSGVENENLFFLFTAKCDTVCVEAGVPKFSIVCMENRVS